VLSCTPENALAESEWTLLRSRGACKCQELNRSTGGLNRSDWEYCMWLPHPLTLWWCMFPGGGPRWPVAIWNLLRDRHESGNTINIDSHGLGYLCQIRTIAIGSDDFPVHMFPLNIQLWSGHFTEHWNPWSTIFAHGKHIPMDMSEDGWRGPGVLRFGYSDLVFQDRECSNVSESNWIWCG